MFKIEDGRIWVLTSLSYEYVGYKKKRGWVQMWEPLSQFLRNNIWSIIFIVAQIGLVMR